MIHLLLLFITGLVTVILSNWQLRNASQQHEPGRYGTFDMDECCLMVLELTFDGHCSLDDAIEYVRTSTGTSLTHDDFQLWLDVHIRNDLTIKCGV